MKKTILLLLVLLSLCASLFALEAESWYVGVSGDYMYNHVASNTGYRVNTNLEDGHGFSVNVPVIYQFTDSLGLETGLRYTQKNWAYLHDYNSWLHEYSKYINSFFEIPVAVNLSVKYDDFAYVTSLGAYIGVWGMQYASDGYIDISGRKGIMPASGFKPFDSLKDNRFEFGFLARAGVEYTIDPVVLFARGSYYLSVTDLSKKYQANIVPRLNHSFSAEVGVLFYLGGNR